MGAYCIFRHGRVPFVAVMSKVVVSIPANCDNDEDNDDFLQRGAPAFLALTIPLKRRPPHANLRLQMNARGGRSLLSGLVRLFLCSRTEAEPGALVLLRHLNIKVFADLTRHDFFHFGVPRYGCHLSRGWV
jgi:hypothetical protein